MVGGNKRRKMCSKTFKFPYAHLESILFVFYYIERKKKSAFGQGETKYENLFPHLAAEIMKEHSSGFNTCQHCIVTLSSQFPLSHSFFILFSFINKNATQIEIAIP
jgi:hypothetical protein